MFWSFRLRQSNQRFGWFFSFYKFKAKTELDRIKFRLKFLKKIKALEPLIITQFQILFVMRAIENSSIRTTFRAAGSGSEHGHQAIRPGTVTAPVRRGGGDGNSVNHARTPTVKR